jgi:hypothetical protein
VGGRNYPQFEQISRLRVAEDASELKLWKDIDEVEMTEPEQEQSEEESDEEDTGEYSAESDGEYEGEGDESNESDADYEDEDEIAVKARGIPDGLEDRKYREAPPYSALYVGYSVSPSTRFKQHASSTLILLRLTVVFAERSTKRAPFHQPRLELYRDVFVW